jgi:hypothetical protein
MTALFLWNMVKVVYVKVMNEGGYVGGSAVMYIG